MTEKQALDILGQAIVNEIPQQLKNNGSYITGNLAKSYTYEVIENQNGYQLNILDNSGKGKYNYGLSVDEGRERKRGKQPPVDDILDWIKFKKIVVPSGFTPKSFAWAVATNIGKKGQTKRKPKPFLFPSVNAVFDNPNERIQEAAATIIEQKLETIFP